MKRELKVKEAKIIFENKKVLKAGYCNLQYTLQYFSPDYYMANKYGWRCDIYRVGDVYVVTGYDLVYSINGNELKHDDCKKIEEWYLNIKNTNIDRQKLINKVCENINAVYLKTASK